MTSQQPNTPDVTGAVTGVTGAIATAEAARNADDDALRALITTISGYVDQLEALETSGNAALAQLHTDIVTTLASYVDGLEALETTIRDRLASPLSVEGTVDTGLDLSALATAAKQDTLVTKLTDGSVRIGGSVSLGGAAKGYQQIASTGLQTPTVPTGATKALIRPTGNARIRDDGTNPTSTVGYPVGPEGFNYDLDQLAALKIYVVSGSVDIYYYA